jgi:hypothetical protein
VQDYSNFIYQIGGFLERFPKKWFHFLDKEERQSKDLERVSIWFHQIETRSNVV